MGENPRLKAALDYASAGWLVLPIWWMASSDSCACHGRSKECKPGKHPCCPGGVDGATREERIIRKWWKRHPLANVAIATGFRSGVWALDIDPRNGGDSSLAQLVAEHDELVETVIQETGGGGFHQLFIAERPVRCGELDKRYPGLDVKGDGGYVLVDPSTHPSGSSYRWRRGCGPDDVDVARAPDWLLDMVGLPVSQGTPVGSVPAVPEIQVTAISEAVQRCLFTGAGRSEEAVRKLVRYLKFDLKLTSYNDVVSAVSQLYDRCQQYTDHDPDYLIAKGWRFMAVANQPVGKRSMLTEAIKAARAKPSARAIEVFRGEHCRLLVPICRELAKMSPTGVFALGGGELQKHLGGKRGHWWERLRINLEGAKVIKLAASGTFSSNPARRKSNLYTYLWPLED